MHFPRDSEVIDNFSFPTSAQRHRAANLTQALNFDSTRIHDAKAGATLGQPLDSDTMIFLQDIA